MSHQFQEELMTGVCATCGAPTYDEQAACPHCGQEDSRTLVEASAAPPRAQEQGRLPENLAALLAYITVIPAIVFLLTKPYSKNEFVRFHAFQSVGIAVAAAAIASGFLLLANVPAINLLLIPVSLIVAIGFALVVLVCIIKAFQHETYPLPLLGKWAQKQSLRS
jgi:uncharacterized membrane protein/DNA-directed RNA polymerase subunit RPC12/RpoP